VVDVESLKAELIAIKKEHERYKKATKFMVNAHVAPDLKELVLWTMEDMATRGTFTMSGPSEDTGCSLTLEDFKLPKKFRRKM